MKGITLKGYLAAILGVVSWSPPVWLVRIGVRRAARGAIVLLAAAAAVVSAFVYLQSLPELLRVETRVTAPGVSSMVDGKPVPDAVRLDFRFPSNAVAPAELSAARIDLVGETIEEGVTMRPSMPGEWRFEGENRLVFLPTDDWPAERSYRIELAPELFAPGIELADSEATFSTPPFTAAITDAELHQHPERVTERRVIASFSFSHPVDRADFEARLSMSVLAADDDEEAERALEYSVEYEPGDRTAHVQSEVVSIVEQEQLVTISVTAGVKPAAGDGSLEDPLGTLARIPDRATYFRVRDLSASIANDTDKNPVQTAIVRFTDQVDTNDFARHIQAWLLPADRHVGDQTINAYAWESPAQVTPAILEASEPLPLSVNPTERAASKLQSVAFDAPEDRYVYFHVAEGLTSRGGFVLSSGFDDVMTAPRYPKEASIVGEGAILSLTGSRRLFLTARGVPAIRVAIHQLLPDTFNHLVSQTSGDIRDPWFRGNMDADDLSTLTQKTIDVNLGHPRERVFTTLDLDPYLPAGGLFFVSVRGWDPEKKKFLGSIDRRMALVTDLGLLVKTNRDKSQHVFVHSIADGQPVAGASIELLGRNGLPVLSATTDARGHARLDSATDFRWGQQPTVFVVRLGDDTTFMPYERIGRRLEWSAFDTGGEQIQAGDKERLKAALYTDRGLYRPGETVQLFGVVRRGDLVTVPGAPVELRITDARGDDTFRKRTTLPADGLVDWRFSTLSDSPTGRYRADIFLVDDESRRSLGGTAFSVEDYRPDRMRIHASIMRGPDQTNPERSWMRPGVHFAEVNLENLFGTPAQGRLVRGQLELKPMSPAFPEYPDVVFTDPFRDPETTPRPVTLQLDQTETGADGTARLEFDLGQYVNGIYWLVLTVEGFEAGGGRSVRAQAGTLLSPAETLVGYKADGDLGFIALNTKRSVRFLAIGRDLAPAALDDLRAVLYQRRYVSALVRKPNGSYAYQSVVKEDQIASEAFVLPAAGADHVLPTAEPGRYALELVDAGGATLSRIEFAVAGAGWSGGELERNAELDIKLDRREYRPGEEIQIEITAPYAGTGLVTVERDRVHAFEWFQSDTTATMARIRVPEGLEGNAYVNVALVRDIGSEEVFVSPLSYAAAPFAIDRSSRRVDIDLAVPQRVRPGEDLVLEYATPEPSRLALYAVDEGILQVAAYQTPDPLERFLRKRALQVDTHQMVDLILPAYEVVRPAAAPGGGDSNRLLQANLNPFRRRSEPPAAIWGGLHEAGPQRRELSLEIPDSYNGELRVVAFGVGEGRLGARARRVTVRGPIVLTPGLPQTVAPDDVFDVAVGVANSVEGSGPGAQIELSATALQRLGIEGDAPTILTIPEGGEGRAILRLKAGVDPGEASMRLVARLDDVNVERQTSLSIRPPVPFETSVVSGFDADGTVEIPLPRRLHPPFASQQVTVSASPLVLADGLIEYIETFPHACVEQMVSKHFPQLGLMRSTALDFDRAAYQDRFEETVDRLRGRQDANGGFRFWTTSDESALFPSVYVTHFLIDARELGMAVPDDMINRAGRFLRRLAGDIAADLPRDDLLAAARTRAYAIYLLTRSGRITTNYLSGLQEMLTREFSDAWRSDLASAYMAASHALLRNDEIAGRLIVGYRTGLSTGLDTDFDTLLGRDAQYLYLLGRHFPERMARLDQETVRTLVQSLFEDRFNTLSASYTVLALGEIHRSLMAAGDLKPSTIVAHASDGPVAVDVDPGAFTRAQLPVAADRVSVEGGGGKGLYFSLSQSGFDAVAPAGRLSEGIEVDRVYLNALGEPVTRTRVGDELTVRLRVRSQRGRLRNVAVTDLLPGGFEIITESIRNNYADHRIEYRDVRDDRLVLYGSFNERLTEITYRVKAISPGEFAAPAAHAEAMYHRGVRGRSELARLVVEGA